MLKVCTKCGLEKDENYFYYRSRISKLRHAQCKECTSNEVSEYQRTEKGQEVRKKAYTKYASKSSSKIKAAKRQAEYRNNNREDYLEKQRIYREQPHVKEQIKNRLLMYKYGITLKEKKTMWKEQNKKCLICFKDIDFKEAVVDHDHETGEIRGILCNNCNAMIGFAADDTGVLESAINYLSKKLY